MKEKYIKPQLEFDEFKMIDIVTTSDGEPDTDIPWGS